MKITELVNALDKENAALRAALREAPVFGHGLPYVAWREKHGAVINDVLSEKAGDHSCHALPVERLPEDRD